ncbi:MAG: tetratricopeptide repeat protein [Firmicutes bacterium]|nr:tetratricopeptide repeat protein [Bacillota bacterium]
MAREVEARLRRAWGRFRRGEREEALAEVADLAARHPEEAAVRGAHAAFLWAAGRRDAAVREAQAALSLDGDEAAAHTVLGQAEMARLRLDRAARHLGRAYARAPTARRAALWVRALREARDLAGAEAALAQELARAGEGGPAPAVRREEALLAEARGDLGRAQALWSELAQAGGGADAAYARARLLALRTREMPAAEAAAELMGAARVRARTDPEAGRAILLAAADRRRSGGDLAGAAEAYRAYLAERPGDPYALRQLAFVLRRLGRAGEARPLLEALLRREPGDVYARNALVADYLAAGEREAGEAFFRALLAEHPQAKGLYAAIARLRARRGGGGSDRSGG